jgi:flagellar hook-length control protein FliK
LLLELRITTETGMDALSLVLPAATISNSGSSGADAGALDARADAATADFAALLAAGLVPQQELAGLLGVPQAGAQAAEPTLEKDAAQTLANAAAGPTPAVAALHDRIMLNAALSPREGAQPGAAVLAEGGVTARAGGQGAAALAAEAATIAAAAAEQAFALTETPNAKQPDAPFATEMDLGAGADATAALGHPLHLPAPEPMAPSRPTAVLEVPASVHGREFADALAQQIVWMADKDAQVAELRINPPELGPVEVRLEISGDEATVQFASAHAEVRNALDGAIARLRESMAQAGISLGEASVSAESFREQAAGEFAREGRDGQRGNRDNAEPSWQSAPLPSAVRRGLVDLFA